MSRFSPGRLSRPALNPACAVPLLLAAAGSAVWAQDGASSGRALVVVPTASVTETVSNNALLRETDRRSDAITQFNAGLHLSSRGPRAKVSLDYQLTGSIHARGTEANTTTNSLRSALAAELVDRWLFLDANAQIGQQSISAFGVQSTDLSVDNPNRTEVRSYTITPSMRGAVGSWATYSAQLSHTQQTSTQTSTGDVTSDTGTFALNSAGNSALGWGASAVRQRSDFQGGRTNTTDSYRAGLNYLVNPELQLSANAGRERSDVLVDAGSNTSTWGVGLNWTPSERTRLVMQRDHRFFGEAHNVTFDWRLPRSVLRFSSSRDLSTGTQGPVNTASIALYDLLFAQLATLQPDPLLRRELVLQELARRGINPNTPVAIGYLSAAPTIITRQEFSFALQGSRTTLTLALFRSESRRANGSAPVNDDFSNANLIRQSGASVTLGHQLTPISGVSLSLSQQRNRGTTAAQANDLQSINLNWTSQLSPRSSVSLGARHVEFDSSTAPYVESAVLATFSVSF
jgi:uncharacterized protein (PEP-CTERM system associated)